MSQVDEDWHLKNCSGYRTWLSCIDGGTDWEYCDCAQGRELKAKDDARTDYIIRQALAALITVAVGMAIFAAAVIICGRIVK